jgi:hypothetical protein
MSTLSAAYPVDARTVEDDEDVGCVPGSTTVAHRLNDLAKATAILAEHVERIEHRLSPILRPPQEDLADPSPKDVAGSAVGDEILSHVQRVIRLTGALRAVTDRIDL